MVFSQFEGTPTAHVASTLETTYATEHYDTELSRAPTGNVVSELSAPEPGS